MVFPDNSMTWPMSAGLRPTCSWRENSYTPRAFGAHETRSEPNETTFTARLSPDRERTLYESDAARIFSPEASALARRAVAGIERDPPAPPGREPVGARHSRSSLPGNRPCAGAPDPRPRAQADQQDR